MPNPAPIAPYSSEHKIISAKEVAALTSLSKGQVHKLAASGEFPVPIPMGQRRVGWIRREVIVWIEERIAERDMNRGGAEHGPT